MKNIKKSKKRRNAQKMGKNEKIESKKKTKNGRKKSRKKKKRGPKGVPYLTYHPRWAQKLIFRIRTVKRKRNEIEAQNKSDFEHPTKTKKMKENERK